MKELADDTHARLDVVSGLIPINSRRRIETLQQTTPVSGIGTTEAIVHTNISASLVNGIRYSIMWTGRITLTVATDIFILRLREDSITGSILTRTVVKGTTDASGFLETIIVEYISVATTSKTFVASLQRTGGTGTATAQGHAQGPRLFAVDQVVG
jgi:hypothetical protein